MHQNRRNLSAGSESELVMILLAAIAMPALAIAFLSSKNENERDWGIFFAAVSIFLWVPVVLSVMFG